MVASAAVAVAAWSRTARNTGWLICLLSLIAGPPHARDVTDVRCPQYRISDTSGAGVDVSWALIGRLWYCSPVGWAGVRVGADAASIENYIDKGKKEKERLAVSYWSKVMSHIR